MKRVGWFILICWATFAVSFFLGDGDKAKGEVEKDSVEAIGAKKIAEVREGMHTLSIYEFEDGIRCAWDVSRSVSCWKK